MDLIFRGLPTIGKPLIGSHPPLWDAANCMKRWTKATKAQTHNGIVGSVGTKTVFSSYLSFFSRKKNFFSSFVIKHLLDFGMWISDFNHILKSEIHIPKQKVIIQYLDWQVGDTPFTRFANTLVFMVQITVFFSYTTMLILKL
jgi:hypothetical protein